MFRDVNKVGTANLFSNNSQGLLQFAELFDCVAFRISLFAEVYHESFDSTMALRNTFYVNVLQQLLHLGNTTMSRGLRPTCQAQTSHLGCPLAIHLSSVGVGDWDELTPRMDARF